VDAPNSSFFLSGKNKAEAARMERIAISHFALSEKYHDKITNGHGRGISAEKDEDQLHYVYLLYDENEVNTPSYSEDQYRLRSGNFAIQKVNNLVGQAFEKLMEESVGEHDSGQEEGGNTDCFILGMTENLKKRMTAYNDYESIKRIPLDKRSLEKCREDGDCMLPKLRKMEMGILDRVHSSPLQTRSGNKLGGGDGPAAESPIEIIIGR
jgi:hypothetical protein